MNPISCKDYGITQFGTYSSSLVVRPPNSCWSHATWKMAGDTSCPFERGPAREHSDFVEHNTNLKHKHLLVDSGWCCLGAGKAGSLWIHYNLECCASFHYKMVSRMVLKLSATAFPVCDIWPVYFETKPVIWRANEKNLLESHTQNGKIWKFSKSAINVLKATSKFLSQKAL